MTDTAPLLAPPARLYRGDITDPDLWECWQPRAGDIVLCTPAKSGTTWTQAILVNLLHRGAPPGPVTQLSPWIDAGFVPGEDKKAALAAQPGRRVIKTHTPGDGFAVRDGVHVVAVYRHPLDVFLSLRKHVANMVGRPDDHPMKQPMDQALEFFLTGTFRDDAVDADSLCLIAEHHARTVGAGRFPRLTVLHYADILADHRGTVAALAAALDIPADAALIDLVTERTGFGAMKARASEMVPEAGSGLWKDETAFFARGGSGGWRDALNAAQVARYRDRLAALVPDPATRAWLEGGSGAAVDN